MPLIVAKHAGFCMGVKQAVDKAMAAAEQARQQGIPCRTLGELIHNPSVVDDLAARGIQAVQTPQQAQGSLLILRSHGVSPQVAQQAREQAHEVLDCTCPFVHKLHREVSQYSAEGAPVILVGDKGHPEVVGTAGWCHGPVFVVSTPQEVDALPDTAHNALLVAQTTFPPDEWQRLSQQILSRFPQVVVKQTICSATTLRQQEARELAGQVDAMIVIGGRHSANTRKLYQTCKAICPDTHLVESAAEIPPHLKNRPNLRIGVTAGASTPDWSLKEVIDSMNDMENKDLNLQPEGEPVPHPESEPVQEAVEQAVQGEAPEVPETQHEHLVAETEAADEGQVVPHPESEPVQEAVDRTEEAAAPEQEAQEQAHAEEPHKAPNFMEEVAASMTRIRAGQTVVGTVVQLTDDEVCVNIGYKSDGLLSRNELVDEDVEMGDEIEVEIVKVNDGEGNVILSQRNIVNRKAWDALMEKYEAGEFVEAVGKEAVKGGLLADIEGVRAFVPASHLAQRYVEKINQFVGQDMRLKIIEVDPQKRRVVASRKEVLALENAAKKEAVWSNLVEGTVVKGIVRRFASFGAFVDLGGVDGLIHITDLSWNRSAQPQDILQTNQEIDVKILSLDRERERIQLGYKQLQPRPWDNVEEKYPVGEIITRNVVRIRPFGAFVELEPGVDGLVHISQVAPTRITKVEDVLSPGQEVNVKILAVDPQAKRISLSIREAMSDGAQQYEAEVPGEEENYDYYSPVTSVQEAVSTTTEVADSPVAAAFRRAAEALQDDAGGVQDMVNTVVEQAETQAEVAAEEAAEEAAEAVAEVEEEAAVAAEEVTEAAEESAEAVEEAAEEVAEEAAAEDEKPEA